MTAELTDPFAWFLDWLDQADATEPNDPNAMTVEDPDARDEQRFVTLGMDALGRTLVTVHTPRGSRIRIISARKASKSEAAEYAKGI